jgi:Cytochrome bd terminal oxidase subunit I
MNVEVLSRIQFGLTVSFHFLFPPMTIGLGVMLIRMQSLRVWTGNPLYLDLAGFWTKIFGLIFAIGVATGIPMEFQFGTNWALYARFVGDIFGARSRLKASTHFFSSRAFSHCCSSAGTNSDRACVCSPLAWSHSARISARSGFWLPTLDADARRFPPRSENEGHCQR